MREKGRGTANRRMVLKLLGAGVVASGASTGVASAEEHIIDAEIEGPLQAVGADGTVTVMGQ